MYVSLNDCSTKLPMSKPNMLLIKSTEGAGSCLFVCLFYVFHVWFSWRIRVSMKFQLLNYKQSKMSFHEINGRMSARLRSCYRCLANLMPLLNFFNLLLCQFAFQSNHQQSCYFVSVSGVEMSSFQSTPLLLIHLWVNPGEAFWSIFDLLKVWTGHYTCVKMPTSAFPLFCRFTTAGAN